MKHIASFFTLVVITTSNAFAQENLSSAKCASAYGNFSKIALRYDQMLADLTKSKSQIDDLNKFVKTDGMPVYLPLVDIDKPPKYEGYLTDIGINGMSATVFTRVMKASKESNLDFDLIYEVESAESKKVLRSWSVPGNSVGNFGIDGNNLVYKETLRGVCNDKVYQDVSVILKTDGQFSLAEAREITAPKNGFCQAIKHLFPKSDYAVCGSITDPKSKKKRYFVWEGPMT